MDPKWFEHLAKQDPSRHGAIPGTQGFAGAMILDNIKNYKGPVRSRTVEGILKFDFADIEKKEILSGGQLIYTTLHARRSYDKEFIYLWDDTVFVAFKGSGEETYFTIYSSNSTRFEQLVAFSEASLDAKNTSGRAFILVAASHGLELKSLGVASEPLVRENYTPDILHDYDHIAADLNAKDPCGRFSLFNGPPGGGKTHLITGLMAAAPRQTFILVQSHAVAKLADPDFVSALLEAKEDENIESMVLVIEDADNCIVPRGTDNMADMSSLLNYGDGIFGKLMDIRTLATTNAKKLEIDKALMRRGRLCRQIDVKPLAPDHALRVYKRLTNENPIKPITDPLPLGDVYGMARDIGWTPTKNFRENRAGFITNQLYHTVFGDEE